MSVGLSKVDHPIRLADAKVPVAMLVAITRDQKIYFGPERVSAIELPPKIREHIRQGAEGEVFSWRMAACDTEKVSEVLDDVGKVGVVRLGILTDQRRGP